MPLVVRVISLSTVRDESIISRTGISSRSSGSPPAISNRFIPMLTAALAIVRISSKERRVSGVLGLSSCISAMRRVLYGRRLFIGIILLLA